jgi:uncharacterized protein involved in exopolysaccharide biosynthesis
MEKQPVSNLFDSTNLLLFIWKKRKPIILITIIAAVASIIFSMPFFIKPKYKSSVVMFPSTNSSLSRSLLSEVASEKENVMRFGEEEECEQMLQILNSDEIRDRIINKYNLMEHYNIKPNSSYPLTKLKRKFSENISFRRTEFLSVEVEVLDTDRDFAANIANDIAAFLDTVKTRMQRERAVQALNIVAKEYNDMKLYIKEKEDTLSKLRNLGLFDYAVQVEKLTEAYSTAILAGKQNVANQIQEQMKIFSEYGGQHIAIVQDMEFEREQLSKLKTRFDQAKVDAEQQIPQKFIVNTAYPAEKKSYPVRWLIAVVSTVGAFLLSIIVLLLLENFQHLKTAYQKLED